MSAYLRTISLLLFVVCMGGCGNGELTEKEIQLRTNWDNYTIEVVVADEASKEYDVFVDKRPGVHGSHRYMLIKDGVVTKYRAGY